MEEKKTKTEEKGWRAVQEESRDCLPCFNTVLSTLILLEITKVPYLHSYYDTGCSDEDC